MPSLRILAALASITVAPRLATAQFTQPVKYAPTVAEAAESLKVLTSLTAHLTQVPSDTAAQFHAGTLAQRLSARAWVAVLPREFTRNKERNANGELVELLNLAVDKYKAAIALDGNNPEYLIAAGWFVCRGAQASVTDPGCALSKYAMVGEHWAVAYFDRALAIFASHPNPPMHAKLLQQLGGLSWDEYEGKQTNATPVAGFMGDQSISAPIGGIAGLPPIPPASSGSTQTAGRTGGATGSAGGAGAMAGGGSSAGMNSEGKPILGPLGGMPGPRAILAPLTVSQAAGAEIQQPLVRMLGVASARVIEMLSLPPGQFFGETAYHSARDWWQRAHAVLPEDELVWRSVALHRAARSNWPELLEFAEERTRLAPSDAWGWMALGLARQRMKQGAAARVALDSGLALLTPAARKHLDRLERVLRPSDSALYVRGDSAFRANAANASWLLALPLWSVEAENPRTEFLARIAFAEIRWGVLRPRMYGADTPQGRLYVRYGPPPAEYNTFWLYNGGLIFAPTSAFTSDIGITRREVEWQPARWDNIAVTPIDSMHVQAARFRATPDSVDFYFGTRAPLDAFSKAGFANAKPFASYWLASRSSPWVFRDSIPLTQPGLMQWTQRVATGPYYYRAEAVVPGALAAARAAAPVVIGTDSATGFTMRGFGLSDLVIASDATAPNAPRRWNDVTFTPLTGAVPHGGRVSMLWENYELVAHNNVVNYHVTMTLVRDLVSKSDVDLLIGGGVTTPVKTKRGERDFTVDFDRTAPYAATIVDNLALSFGATPPGNYTLTITVKDNATGQSRSRSTRIELAK